MSARVLLREIRVNGRRYLLLPDAARAAHMSPCTLWTWAQRGWVAKEKRGVHRYICISSLNQHLSSQPETKLNQIVRWLKQDLERQYLPVVEIQERARHAGIECRIPTVRQALRRLRVNRKLHNKTQVVVAWLTAHADATNKPALQILRLLEADGIYVRIGTVYRALKMRTMP